MNIKNSIAAVATLGLLSVGYVAGAYIGFPLVENSMLKGDISKAKVYNEAQSEDVQAALEVLANDTALQKQTVLAATVLDTRIAQMQELADWTGWEEEGWQRDSVHPDILWEQFGLSSVDKRLKNTREAYDEYLNSLAAAIKGEAAEDFEQKSNNALLAYTIVEKNIKAIAPEMSNALLLLAEQTESKKAADLAAKWIQFGAESAFLDDSQKDMAFWQSQIEAVAQHPVLSSISVINPLGCRDGETLANIVVLRLSKADNVLESITSANIVGFGKQDVLNLLGHEFFKKSTDIRNLGGRSTIGNRADFLSLVIPEIICQKP